MHFLGYRRKPSGKLDSRSPGLGVWSDWPDLNDLCGWANVALEWVGPNSEVVTVTEGIISDPNIFVRATINNNNNYVEPSMNSHPLMPVAFSCQRSSSVNANTGPN